MTGTASPENPTHDISAAHLNNGDGHVDDQPPSSPLSDADEILKRVKSETPELQIDDESALDQQQQESSSPAQDVDQPAPKTNGHAKDEDTNGHIDDVDLHDDGRPAKRRRVRDTTPPPNSAPRKKVESPPWKRIEAEGPSTFRENGLRKSGRINTVPLELQRGDKRITRRSLHAQGSPATKNKTAAPNGHVAPTQPSKRPVSSGKPAPSKATTTSKSSNKKPVQETRSSARTRRRSSSPTATTTPPRASARTRRSSRNRRESTDAKHAASTPSHDARNGAPVRVTPRIKLRMRPPLTELPIVHPEQTKMRPKIGSSFEDYFVQAAELPVESGGQLASEDGPQLTEDMALKEARSILRIEDEVGPGGLLSEERCSAFEPEPAEEPPRQWAHMDHLTKAMTNFRKLMFMEHQRHRAAAKKLAEACRDEWIRRQPKSAEQLEQEARIMWIGRYRLVVKSLFGTWENVKAEINRRRLEEWEAAEQKRVKAALQEAVNLSEQKLLARQAHADSEGLTDDEDDEDDELEIGDELGEDADLSSDSDVEIDSDAESGADEDNMSSSSDEDEDRKSVASDEGLTQDQLREKYANLPALESNEKGDEGTPGSDLEALALNSNDDDTSDESVDMDDDLGSTDMDSEDEDGSDEDIEDSDEADEEPSGLLGLFFGKKELKKMQEEATPDATETPGVDGDGDTAMLNDVDTQPPLNQEPKTDADEQDKQHDSKDEQQTEQEDTSNHNIEQALSADTALAQPQLDVADDRPQNATSSTNPPETSSNLLDHTSRTDGSSVVLLEKQEGLTTTEAENSAPDSRPIQQELAASQDVSMIDAPQDQAIEENNSVPEVEITAPVSAAKQTSPETDAVTNVVSPDPSQSPRTSETKPSEVDTASSVEHLSVLKDASRSTSPQPSTKTEIPFLLRGTLREYQHDGLDWLAGLYANNTNGILADEMGLGKTIQTIALLAHLACHHEVWGPHLVIVPTSVMLNWEMEFKKWCPGFKILTYYGTQEERKRKRQGWTNDDIWNVCITSYQIVLQDQQVFKRRRWHYMILDEAHNIKNFRSQRWQTLLGFNTHSRLLLTGTPLQNNLTELWSLLFFLMPSENGVGGFADLREFHDWFHKPESQILESGREQMDEEARAIISKLHKVLRPYLLRRLKADVEKQMPAKHEHVEFCRLSKRQRELYDGFLARTETRETLSSGNYLSIINCLMQLRKVCNHPDLFIDRPIMTSLRMNKSVAADFGFTEQLIRNKLTAKTPMSSVSLGFLNLVPTEHEDLSKQVAERIFQLSSHRVLMDLRENQKTRANNAYLDLDPATAKSNIVYLESAARWGRFEELQHCVYLNALRRQQKPIYGKGLRDFLTIGVDQRPYKPRPRVPREIMTWFEEDSFILRTMIPTISQRAASMENLITKFACVTPAVVTRDLNQYLLGTKLITELEEVDLKLSAPVKTLPFIPRQPPLDPWHEARMRLSIQFPDKRLLQYDCGKLQALDKLLRKLQAGGHRALIFTQMTKVLDILERFLNIHGHKYLRLDGSTKVEQRQILTDRFNVDNRILCFILSTRSGGLGLNLTGADTVIFYDQDWNPAMDKQCQDRCHRIGQTRDVHIYRLVSEHTIEANILRKASQKQMLDDVVIQEGEFTTDYFNKLSVHDVLGGADQGGLLGESDAVANEAMDRVLGGVETTDQKTAGRALEQAEDTEDVIAARAAEKEIQQDDADFQEKSGGGSGVSSVRQGTPREGSMAPATLGKSGLGLFAESADDVLKAEEVEVEYNAFGEPLQTIDDYMLKIMAAQLAGTPLELPKDKKKSKKKGKDTRKR